MVEEEVAEGVQGKMFAEGVLEGEEGRGEEYVERVRGGDAVDGVGMGGI
jgi:hypothetical protein